jgi:putative membrane protein
MTPELQNFLWNAAMAVLFTVLGLLLFGLAFKVMTRVSPFSIRKELEEDHNTAVAVVMGAVIIGVAIIVAAAMN